MKKEALTKEQRWQIADALAEERLEIINKGCNAVNRKTSFYVKYGKRIMDIIISGTVLLVTLPINIVILIITFFDVGTPIFFRQERIGKDGIPFYLLKFRNMKETKDERGELLPAELRVTRFGRFVRKTSLDELLNFWSIFKGDMSLIGPRPLVTEYMGRYSKRHQMRHAVKPGLECPPRIIPNHAVTWTEQFENDIWYVENVSFLTDCFMCVQLFKFAFNRKNIRVRSIGKRGIFAGYDWDGSAITYDDLTEQEFDYYLNYKKDIGES